MFFLPFVNAEGEFVQLPQNEADRQTFLNNVTDTLAIIGKSGKEKEQVLRERKALRREERLRNQRRKQDIQTKKQMKKQQKVIMEKVKAVDKARYSKTKKVNKKK